MIRPRALGVAALGLLATAALGAIVEVPVSPSVAMAGYEARLNAYQPLAASAFLADKAAQSWLKSSRPGLLLPSLQRAHEILDLRALPEQYEDPVSLRQALRARAQELSAESPAKLREVYASWDLSPDEQLRVKRALMEWRTLAPDMRRWLSEAGQDVASWKDKRLAERTSAVLKVLAERVLQDDKDAAMDGEAYRRCLTEYARRAWPFLSVDAAYSLKKFVELHARVAAGLRRARAAARRAGDDALSAKLAKATRGSLDSAQAVLERFDGTSPPPISARVLRGVAERLPAAVRRLARGTSAAPIVAEALDRVVVAALETSQGVYDEQSDRLLVNRGSLEAFLTERGRPAEDLLADPALLEDFALEIAPIVVHEATHRLQSLRARAAGLSAIERAGMNNQEHEREAFLVQRAFVRAYAAAHPEAAAALAGREGLAIHWNLEIIGKAMDTLHYSYSNVPSLHGSRARAVRLARWRASAAQRRKPAIEAELARAGDRSGTDWYAPDGRLSSFSARALRALLEAARPGAALALTRRYFAYLDALDARIRAWPEETPVAQR